MSRNEQLERILQARFEYDYSPRETKAYFQKQLFDLVDAAIANTDISRNELLHCLHDRYLEYKREVRKKDKVSISQRLH